LKEGFLMKELKKKKKKKSNRLFLIGFEKERNTFYSVVFE